jgi:RNA-binding protein
MPTAAPKKPMVTPLKARMPSAAMLKSPRPGAAMSSGNGQSIYSGRMDSAERRALKARAHKLDPVVQIGAKGVTEEVIAEIDRALKAHQLIKVRAGSLDRGQRDRALVSILEQTKAEPVQQVGKVFVLFRKNDE